MFTYFAVICRMEKIFFFVKHYLRDTPPGSIIPYIVFFRKNEALLPISGRFVAFWDAVRQRRTAGEGFFERDIRALPSEQVGRRRRPARQRRYHDRRSQGPPEGKIITPVMERGPGPLVLASFWYFSLVRKVRPAPAGAENRRFC